MIILPLYPPVAPAPPSTPAKSELLQFIEESATYTINYVVDLPTSKSKAS